MNPVIIDAGPLVALADVHDHYHQWASQQLKRLSFPILSCEAVFSEAHFLVRHLPHGSQMLAGFVSRGLVTFPFSFQLSAARVLELIEQYGDLPMSFADACVVCMAEQNPRGAVFTVDAHFRIYRKHGKLPIPVIMP